MSFRISKSRTKRSKQRSKTEAQEAGRGTLTRAVNLAIIGAMWLFVMVLLHGGQPVGYSNLAPGQRAPATVIAAADFTCLDLGRTQLKRQEAAESIPPVFAVDYRPLHAATRSLDKIYDRVIRLRANEDEPLTKAQFETAIADVIDLLELSVKPGDVLKLAPEGEEEELLEGIKEAITEAWKLGILSGEEKETAFHGVAARGRILIRQTEKGGTKEASLRDIMLPDEAVRTASALIRDRLPEQDFSDSLLSRLLDPWMVPNLVYDRGTTDKLREDEQKAVEPVVMSIREGTMLVERGKIATPQIVEQLRAHEIKLSGLQTVSERLLKIVGNGSLLLIALAVCGGLMRIIRPSMPQVRTSLVLLVLLSLVTLLPAKGIHYLSTSTRLIPPGLLEFILPLALAPLLTTLLIGGATAVVIGLWTSIASAVMLGNSFSVLTMGLIATVVSAYAARNVRKRSRVFKAGLWVGLASMVYAVSLAALNQPEPIIVVYQAAASLVSGMLCALIAMLLVPLFELLFSITTDITLLEYSDLGNPILQRLAKEAPGTYHHSLMVSDLGRAAAAEIGANELQVRVCAYFHDIGKLTKPEFFSENQQFCDNPHDDLAPSMSTLVIIAHVKEGVTMARQHKLPRPIIEGIERHHGTSLISFFYHRAKQQQDTGSSSTARTNGRKLNEGDFRYEGPKPATREQGILLLADSVEAASRSMSKPTANRIETLVEDIVSSRVRDGQLDECGLTFAELSIIKRSFVFSLTSMLHGRIEYPQDENRDKQSSDTTPGESGKPSKADPTSHAQRATA